MFSGIIEEVGTVVSYDGETLIVGANQVLNDLKISESIMVAGACLTVTELAEDGSTFTVETVPETRTRTNYGDLKSGDSVNLERALRHGDRVGGHMVQGHVDGVGTVRSVIEDGNSRLIVIEAPANIIDNVVEKGFITVDGTSLTIVELNADSFSIAIIPYTFAHTTFSQRPEGSRVNLEADVTAKYVAKLIEPYLDNLSK
mgnify:FL=1